MYHTTGKKEMAMYDLDFSAKCQDTNILQDLYGNGVVASNL